ncbi:hypothetical protein DsansV1_C03g0029191 [Dioscorea sansibarensis]
MRLGFPWFDLTAPTFPQPLFHLHPFAQTLFCPWPSLPISSHPSIALLPLILSPHLPLVLPLFLFQIPSKTPAKVSPFSFPSFSILKILSFCNYRWFS